MKVQKQWRSPCSRRGPGTHEWGLPQLGPTPGVGSLQAWSPRGSWEGPWSWISGSDTAAGPSMCCH